jgi:hypothetical protein
MNEQEALDDSSRRKVAIVEVPGPISGKYSSTGASLKVVWFAIGPNVSVRVVVAFVCYTSLLETSWVAVSWRALRTACA